MQLARRQIYAYVALAVVVVALGVRYLIVPRTAGAGGEPALVLAAVSPSPPVPGPSGAADVVVYVCGAVRRPGVVRLPAGARVADALELAGGPTGRAELDAVNLAAKVGDGQQIVVPEKPAQGTGAPAAGAATGTASAVAAPGATAPGALVNINTASAAELEMLSGIGPSTAQKIIDYRTANGGFTSIEQLMDVPGIGEAKFAAVKDSITI